MDKYLLAIEISTVFIIFIIVIYYLLIILYISQTRKAIIEHIDKKYK